MAGIKKDANGNKVQRDHIRALDRENIIDPANPLQISSLERQMMALELRKAGGTFQQVADQLGFADPSSAKRAVEAALERIQVENVDETRRMEIERLNHLQVKWWGIHNNPKTEPELAAKATEMILKIINNRARLNGLFQGEITQNNNIIEIRNVDDWRRNIEIPTDPNAMQLPEHQEGEFIQVEEQPEPATHWPDKE